MDLFHQLHDQILQTAEKNLFFIIGVAKSGTTWLQQLLNGHPDICCDGESHLINLFIPQLMEIMTQHNQVILSKNQMLGVEETGYPLFGNQEGFYLAKSAFCLMLHAQTRGRNYRFIGEKTPDSIRHLDELSLRLFPEAKFIHIIRDGRDGAVSGWHHIYRDSPEWAKERFPQFIDYADTFSRTWREEVELARAFGRQHPTKYLEIKYENLHQHSAHNVEIVLRFLGAAASPAAIESCLAAGSFTKLSQGRNPGEEDNHSHYRKGIIGDWQNHFDETSLAMFIHNAGELLQELGYPTLSQTTSD